MNLFKKNYPTRKEYYKKIKEIQENELNSERYMSTYEFMANNYWNKQNESLEEKLFYIVGSYGIEDEIINMPDDYKKIARLKRYAKLKSFLDSLTEKQINSNIYLKSACLFVKTSIDDCPIIINQLNEIINSQGKSGSVRVESDIPASTKLYIPDYISSQVGIPYYKPEVYKTEYIDILDQCHMHVYIDYNECVGRIGKIAEDIYFLQLNNILATISDDLMCYGFHIYHPGYNNRLISSFFVSRKENIKEQTNQESFTPSDEFVQITVNNFQMLLDMGLVDMTMLKDKNDGPVLKKSLTSEYK